MIGFTEDVADNRHLPARVKVFSVMATYKALIVHELGLISRAARRFSRCILYSFCILSLPLWRKRLFRNFGVTGKSVLVVGSAPSASLEALDPFDFVIGVHASPLLIESKFGLVTDLLVCDVTVFDSEYAAKEPGRRAVLDSGALSISPKKRLVVVGHDSIRETAPYAETAKFSKFLRLSLVERRAILAWASRSSVLNSDNNHSMVGTGGFAIALAFFAGAKSVQFTGFNLRNGTSDAVEYPHHFYDDMFSHDLYAPEQVAEDYMQSKPRTHSSADSFLISSLYLQEKSIRSNEPDFEALLANWWRL